MRTATYGVAYGRAAEDQVYDPIDVIPPGASDARTADALQRLDRLAALMDSAVRVPGTQVRIGLDAALGLIPGVGDIASKSVSAYIIYEAQRMGLPTGALLRMAGNVALDLAIGAVPLVGDLFDVFWRANRRNMEILRGHLAAGGRLP
ncbi:MAG: DUF4112 domain-containing protein [Alphaproteobacteria bacterium]|nr:DUF4112 domain-containing protein [Alphaproteobacteria bacterium]